MSNIPDASLPSVVLRTILWMKVNSFGSTVIITDSERSSDLYLCLLQMSVDSPVFRLRVCTEQCQSPATSALSECSLNTRSLTYTQRCDSQDAEFA